VFVGSFAESSAIVLKDKFFDLKELLGESYAHWTGLFSDGDFAVFRLTPDKYHYNHVPVSGVVRDFYEIEGCYHPCNPHIPVTVATPLSKNKRVVTIIDTDIEGGTGIGMVTMVEIVALMIGDIVQCYSDHFYDDPCRISSGMLLMKGSPKSLYRPGSSTDVLIFERGRIDFSADIVHNMHNPHAQSRYSLGLGRPLVETEVRVREEIARAHSREDR
jgi:phosphatidylserine decarboxylase